MLQVNVSDNIIVTRDNIDELLDGHALQIRLRPVLGKPEKWWTIRRNGQTGKRKKDPAFIRIPIKAGMFLYDRITTEDFLANGQLNPERFRLNPTYIENGALRDWARTRGVRLSC